MRRRSVVLAAVPGALISTLAVGRSTSAQDATPPAMATHPIVGAWLSITPPPPVPSIFAADGTASIAYPPIYVDPILGLTFQGPMIGAWEPIIERGIHFTAIQVLTDAEGTFVGTFTLEGHPLVSEDGQSFTDATPDARIIVRDATNTILVAETIAAGVTAYRITPGSLLPGSPALPVATPTAATPAP